jgi:hypothetical protein
MFYSKNTINKVVSYLLNKTAAHLQKPQIFQKVRQPTAIIIKSSPEYIKNNKYVYTFYNSLADYMRKKNYSVTTHDCNTVPCKADVWLGHASGASLLKFAPEGVKTIAINSNIPGSVNHSLNSQHTLNPGIFNYLLSPKMQQALDNKLK